MNIINFKASLIAIALAAVLAGCSSGSSDSGGTGGTGVTTGTVTATSNVGPGVEVNGVTFNESNATVIINDSTEPGEHGGIKVGMTVKIRGSQNGTTGRATDIEAEHAVEGFVESNDGVDTLVVLGQTVQVSGQTLYEGGTFVSLAPGTKIEVYGLRDENNVIRATLIEVKTDDNDFEEELRGVISNLNTGAGTFELNGVIVSYDNISTTFDDGSITDLADGLTVEVHFDTAISGFLATEIEFEDVEDSEFQTGEDSELEIEGYVTAVNSGALTFQIGSQTVQTNAGTTYNDANTFSNILVGERVQVQGVISGGNLVAEEIDIQ